jgi:hypothetical protein
MTTKQLDHEKLTPVSIEVNEQADTVTIVMPLLPFDCETESGKMNPLATTNGWLKTQEICPRTAKQIQVNIFLGTRT